MDTHAKTGDVGVDELTAERDARERAEAERATAMASGESDRSGAGSRALELLGIIVAHIEAGVTLTSESPLFVTAQEILASVGSAASVTEPAPAFEFDDYAGDGQ